MNINDSRTNLRSIYATIAITGALICAGSLGLATVCIFPASLLFIGGGIIMFAGVSALVASSIKNDN